MSNLINKIKEELVEAQKARDEVRVSTLRMLTSAFKNSEIELGHELTEDETLQVVVKNAKQHKESISAYEQAGRDDLVKSESAELEILAKYLPEQMGEDEIGKMVEEALAGGERDRGKIMGKVMAQVQRRADGGEVSRIVGEKLAKLNG